MLRDTRLAAVLSLAIGIGANTAIFSAAHAILLKPLPYKDADRLAILWNRSPGLNIAEDWFSTAQYFDIKQQHSGLETVALALGANLSLTGTEGDAVRVGAIRVSSNLLPMLGTHAALGRLFTEAEDHPGQPAVALLSHALWSSRFGADPSIVNQKITLNGQPVTVAGVLPRGFSLPREVLPTLGVTEDGEIFLPLPLPDNASTIRTREDYNIMATLKPGVTLAAAQAEMDGLTARLRQDHPDVYPPNGGLTFSIVPIHEQVSGRIERPLVLLVGAVGFVLLIACVNVANLLLARAIARRREFAVRAALGASRGALVRLQLMEGAKLAAAGAALGVLLAAGAIRWIRALRPADVPRLDDITINLPVLAFTLGIAVLAALIFSLAPALGAGRARPQDALADATRGSSGAGALWGRARAGRRWLVAGQIALSVMLLVGAGLLIRSFRALQDVPPGFNPDGVMTVELSLAGTRYPNGPAVIEGYKTLWARLGAIPGVTAAGGVTSLPMSGFFAWGPITVEGRVPPPGEKFINADIRTAAGAYFDAMGIPLERGRVFDDRDGLPDAQRVAIIDTLMAQTLWPGEDPIGKRLKFGDAASTSPWETVVGVVGRVKQYGLDADARIAYYRPHLQSPARNLFVAVRTNGDLAALGPAIAREVRTFDSKLPLYHLRPMSRLVDASMARQRFAMTLLTGFAGIALVLAAVGIYGVMAYHVTQGTRDIGIRIALGATPGGVLRLVMRYGAVVAAIGLAAGLAGAWLGAHVMADLVFGITPRDIATFAAATLVLGFVALVALWLPARRASRVDPTHALRG
jgi:predicted permease